MKKLLILLILASCTTAPDYEKQITKGIITPDSPTFEFHHGGELNIVLAGIPGKSARVIISQKLVSDTLKINGMSPQFIIVSKNASVTLVDTNCEIIGEKCDYLISLKLVQL